MSEQLNSASTTSSARSFQFRERGDRGDSSVPGWDVDQKNTVTNVSESTWRKRR